MTASDNARATTRASDIALPTQRSRSSSAQGRGSARDLQTYAALDLGTNNCRLLIARPTRSGFRVIEAFSRIVRLGEGVGQSNELNERAIRRTIEALKICGSKMDARGVDRARLIATEACRMALNGQEFLARVQRETGMQLEIVDRRTEAHLAAEGCAALADPESDGVVLFDIGGGSSEIVWLDGPYLDQGSDKASKGDRLKPQGSVESRVRAWTSLPLGVVTLAEKHGGINVTRKGYATMVDEVRDALADFAQDLSHVRGAGRFHIMGTSGTVTTIAGLHLALPRYDRRAVDGLWMGDGEVSRVIEDLLGMDYGQRAANPCIGHERADLVLAGCAILDGIRNLFPSTRLRIADRGLREGILIGMMTEDGVWADD